MKNVIFLVEDSSLAIKILKKGLGKKYPDCEVVLAENFEEAKRLFGENKERIAVVLSDINIPKNEEITKEGPWGKEIIKKSLEGGFPTICISGALHSLDEENELYAYTGKGLKRICQEINRLTDLGKKKEPGREINFPFK